MSILTSVLLEGLRKFARHERYFFWLLCAAYLLPVWLLPFFPTLDGPAHLYNARLTYELLAGDTSFLEKYYYFNTFPEPNWTGHFLLAFFGTFASAATAEKLILSLYILGLPLSFRFLVKTVHPHGVFTDYLIFPFIYSFVFYLGFYNFCLGLPLLFLALTCWIRIENHRAFPGVLLFSLLLLLLYFSHIFLFVISCVIIAAIIIWSLFFERFSSGQWYLRAFFKKSQVAFAGALPALALTVAFLLKSPVEEAGSRLSVDELIRWIKIVRPLISLNLEMETGYTVKLFYLLFGLCAALVVAKLFRLWMRRENSGLLLFSDALRRRVSRNDVWLLVSGLMIVLYFVLPDTRGVGGYISVRICMLFFLMLIVWIASQEVNRWIGLLAMVAMLWINFGHIKYLYSESVKLSNDAVELHAVSDKIKPNSTLLPLNYSDNWMHSHFSNYLGADKNLVIFENYEAANKCFTVLWQPQTYPYTTMPMHLYPPCPDIERYERETPGRVDYVLLWRYRKEIQDSCTQRILKRLSTDFERVAASPYEAAILYKRK
ncbi:MAG: hypothetical protein AB1458_06785 [Bacteroidota bacterium]